MRTITHIVVHCSATPPTMDIGAKEIRNWHVNDRGWRDIGYHYVIRLDGTVEVGRKEENIGAHVAGHNSNSIGVCYVGGVDASGKAADTRTAAQKKRLRLHLEQLKKRFPNAQILGHRDFPGVAKACPSFDAKKTYAQL